MSDEQGFGFARQARQRFGERVDLAAFLQLKAFIDCHEALVDTRAACAPRKGALGRLKISGPFVGLKGASEDDDTFPADRIVRDEAVKGSRVPVPLAGARALRVAARIAVNEPHKAQAGLLETGTKIAPLVEDVIEFVGEARQTGQFRQFVRNFRPC